MNASSLEEATEIDYFITNVENSKATSEWIVNTYSNRNWIEVFYREAKGWLELKEYELRDEYQLRDKWSLERHFILVFCAYTFIIWHKLTGALEKQWASGIAELKYESRFTGNREQGIGNREKLILTSSPNNSTYKSAPNNSTYKIKNTKLSNHRASKPLTTLDKASRLLTTLLILHYLLSQLALALILINRLFLSKDDIGDKERYCQNSYPSAYNNIDEFKAVLREGAKAEAVEKLFPENKLKDFIGKDNATSKREELIPILKESVVLEEEKYENSKSDLGKSCIYFKPIQKLEDKMFEPIEFEVSYCASDISVSGKKNTGRKR
ncbi:hypothetical protein CYANOKiyG1_22070 [Okeania sp. KiyG1]|nr:hypothetical protein CYANOKiyG1_22070 [Okeania sp. KiyG1]